MDNLAFTHCRDTRLHTQNMMSCSSQDMEFDFRLYKEQKTAWCLLNCTGNILPYRQRLVNEYGRIWREKQEVFICFKYPCISRHVENYEKKKTSRHVAYKHRIESGNSRIGKRTSNRSTECRVWLNFRNESFLVDSTELCFLKRPTVTPVATKLPAVYASRRCNNEFRTTRPPLVPILSHNKSIRAVFFRI